MTSDGFPLCIGSLSMVTDLFYGIRLWLMLTTVKANNFTCPLGFFKTISLRIGIRYWPSARSRWLDIGRVLFLRFLWTETKNTFVNQHELWRNFICGNETGSPKRAVSLHLARSGSQSEQRIRRILPARGACHIIICSSAAGKPVVQGRRDYVALVWRKVTFQIDQMTGKISFLCFS